MELIKNNPDYWEFIRNLRNMEGVKEGFIEQVYIENSHHKMYMEGWGNEASLRLFEKCGFEKKYYIMEKK